MIEIERYPAPRSARTEFGGQVGEDLHEVIAVTISKVPRVEPQEILVHTTR